MSEEKAQQLLYQMQMLETYLGDLINKENNLVNIIREAASAIGSIKALNETTESETLVPMGIGAFVKAKIQPNQKLILNLGAGAAVEKDKDSAINYLESRIKEMEVALRETNARKQEIATSLEQGKQEMNNLVQASRIEKQ
ncbi:MAG: prefoldin subunit alpha [Thaumarchaeota archaeon]|nr:prefoldin subunit alpha [Nitrososphaerota archaeon]